MVYLNNYRGYDSFGEERVIKNTISINLKRECQNKI